MPRLSWRAYCELIDERYADEIPTTRRIRGIRGLVLGLLGWRREAKKHRANGRWKDA
jgi:hypothetical protein